MLMSVLSMLVAQRIWFGFLDKDQGEHSSAIDAARTTPITICNSDVIQ